MVNEKPAPMWAQNVKNTIEKFPPSSKIFFRRRPRRRRHPHRRSCRNHHLVRGSPSVGEEWCVKRFVGGSGSEKKHLNVIRVNSRCCRSSSFHHQNNKTTEKHREFSSSSSPSKSLNPSAGSLSALVGINPNKLVASIVEGFNRGSVGSAREPLWMEV